MFTDETLLSRHSHINYSTPYELFSLTGRILLIIHKLSLVPKGQTKLAKHQILTHTRNILITTSISKKPTVQFHTCKQRFNWTTALPSSSRRLSWWLPRSFARLTVHITSAQCQVT